MKLWCRNGIWILKTAGDLYTARALPELFRRAGMAEKWQARLTAMKEAKK